MVLPSKLLRHPNQPSATGTDLGIYVHVPFCSTRCGYCDFNTYTPQELRSGELGGASVGNTIAGYLDALEWELEAAAKLWDRRAIEGGPPRPIDTVFFGGGTPSLLGHEGLSRALRAIQRNFELAPDAEVTTESNPESTSPEYFEALAAAGFTRVSLGMQSAAGHVLKVLERAHTPGRPVAAAREAAAAGIEHINLDLIYGTPGERDEDLVASLNAVLEAGVDHVSAYSLIVEDGTAMARKVRRGELPAPDEDVLADRYLLIDSFLRDAGFDWYEVSNWARPGGQCRHNLMYWRSGQWWGAGPGAHGCVRLRGEDHVTRLVNAKRPATYWAGLQPGAAPQDEDSKPTGAITMVEPLSAADVEMERVMLGLRLAEGLSLPELEPSTPAGPGETEVIAVVQRFESLGLLAREGSRIRLTDQGRYVADGIVADILVARDPE